MENIKINFAFLDANITILNNLAEEWRTSKVTPPVIKGAGKTATEFKNMLKLYNDLNDRMVTLAACTASLLKNIKNTYQTADDDIAKTMNTQGQIRGRS